MFTKILIWEGKLSIINRLLLDTHECNNQHGWFIYNTKHRKRRVPRIQITFVLRFFSFFFYVMKTSRFGTILTKVYLISDTLK